MATRFSRHPWRGEPRDDDGARRAAQALVEGWIRAEGAALPRFISLSDDGFVSILVPELLRAGGGHPGATLHALRAAPSVRRAWAAAPMTVLADDGEERRFAVLFELFPPDGPRWRVDTLTLRADPPGGRLTPAGGWEHVAAMDGADALWPFLLELASPPEDARSADLTGLASEAPTTAGFEVRTGTLPDTMVAPKDARGLADLAASMLFAPLTRGALRGPVVLRLQAASWMVWSLDGLDPSWLDDVVRTIVHRWPPPADGVALALLTRRDLPDGPARGMQIVAELGGEVRETFTALPAPGDPSPPRTIAWPPRPAPETGLWLAVHPQREIPLRLPGIDA